MFFPFNSILDCQHLFDYLTSFVVVVLIFLPTWFTLLIGSERKASLLLPQNRICSHSFIKLIPHPHFTSSFQTFLLCLSTFLCYVLCDFKVLSWINFPNCMQMSVGWATVFSEENPIRFSSSEFNGSFTNGFSKCRQWKGEGGTQRTN